MGQSASFPLEPFGISRKQSKGDLGTNPPATLQLGETPTSTTSHSSLELKLWMKLTLKLPYRLQTGVPEPRTKTCPDGDRDGRSWKRFKSSPNT